MLHRSSLPLVVLLALVGFGCEKKEAAAAAVPPEAAQTFEQRCASCHGADGTGSGAAAAAMNPKPRNFTDSAWQGTVTDDQIKDAIVKGGAAIGKSASMPPNPDLEAKPEVVNGLVALIRSKKK